MLINTSTSTQSTMNKNLYNGTTALHIHLTIVSRVTRLGRANDDSNGIPWHIKKITSFSNLNIIFGYHLTNEKICISRRFSDSLDNPSSRHGACGECSLMNLWELQKIFKIRALIIELVAGDILVFNFTSHFT